MDRADGVVLQRGSSGYLGSIGRTDWLGRRLRTVCLVSKVIVEFWKAGDCGDVGGRGR